jgi:hypothetical protein
MDTSTNFQTVVAEAAYQTSRSCARGEEHTYHEFTIQLPELSTMKAYYIYTLCEQERR